MRKFIIATVLALLATPAAGEEYMDYKPLPWQKKATEAVLADFRDIKEAGWAQSISFWAFRHDNGWPQDAFANTICKRISEFKPPNNGVIVRIHDLEDAKHGRLRLLASRMCD